MFDNTYIYIDSHISLVVVADLLDANVIFSVDKGLGCGISLGQSHDTGDVLEVVLIIDLHLRSEHDQSKVGHQCVT